MEKCCKQNVHKAMAMLVRREGETLSALLKRLDKVVGRFNDTGYPTDEINPPNN